GKHSLLTCLVNRSNQSSPINRPARFLSFTACALLSLAKSVLPPATPVKSLEPALIGRSPRFTRNPPQFWLLNLTATPLFLALPKKQGGYHRFRSPGARANLCLSDVQSGQDNRTPTILGKAHA